MSRQEGVRAVVGLGLLMACTVTAANASDYQEVTNLMNSARTAEAEVFAPRTWEKALKAYEGARESRVGGRSRQAVAKEVEKAREFVENAMKATEVAKLTLEQYLPQRDKAKTARAPVLVPDLYRLARTQFIKATGKVESGDVKGGLREAERSTALYDRAELEAIRVDILGAADRLIERAVADDATKFAPSTLDKARAARSRADALITNDRYDRPAAETEATLASYEARHASNVALSVRSLNRNDQAWEKLMLVYEIQINRVGQEIGLRQLPFDEGPRAAADSIIRHFEGLNTAATETSSRSATLSGNMTEKLRGILSLLGETPAVGDPLELADLLNERVEAMNRSVRLLEEKVQTTQSQYTALKQEHETLSGELSSRLMRESRYRKTKESLNPSEGEVLFNSSNDIVLRLSGLSFDVGKADIKDEHVSLLGKVEGVLSEFPDAQFVIEGHTDASGEPLANVQLSEKRAFAVMQYLRQSLHIPADRIRAIGYGAERPIASEQSSEGRSKNRRIDILILQ